MTAADLLCAIQRSIPEHHAIFGLLCKGCGVAKHGLNDRCRAVTRKCKQLEMKAQNFSLAVWYVEASLVVRSL